MYIGTQIKPGEPILKSLKEVVKNEGNVVQIFLRKTHSSSKKDKFEIKNKKEIKQFLKENEVKGFVHASYLLNFCRVPVGLVRIQWAYDILREDMELAGELGMKGVVVHMCSKNAVDEKWKPLKLTTEETIKRNIEHLDYFLSKCKTKTKLLLENSSSEGGKIGGNLEEFGKVFRPLYKKYGNRVGTCLDTCHAFASGYPLSTVIGFKNFISDYKKYVGDLRTLKLIHLNDSKEPLGSKKDRHMEIGKGYIFKDNKESLKFLVGFAEKHKIPMCLETNSSYKKELRLIRKIYEASGGKGKISKEEIIKILEEFAGYHKSLGNQIKAGQYSKAVSSVKKSDIKIIRTGNELLSLDYVGKGITSKIDEYLNTGKIELLEEFRRNPIILAQVELTNVFGIGPKKARELIKMKIYSVEDLKKNEKKAKLSKSQKIGLKYHEDLKKRIPRSESEKVKKIIKEKVKEIYKNKSIVELAGSYKQGKETSGDIDIIVSLKNNEKTEKVLKNVVNKLFESGILIQSLSSKLPGDSSVSYMGIIKLKGHPNRHLDLHVVRKEDLPFHNLYFSSGEKFSRKIRKIAKEKGYKLNEKGLYKNNERVKNIKTEKNIFKKLNMDWVSPEERNV